MSTAREHYDNFLGEHYLWMVGDFDAKAAEQMSLLKELGMRGPGLALDLGCGPGYQSIALADLGFSVVALDTNETLLQALSLRKGSRDIVSRRLDIREAASLPVRRYDVVACMGDTLPHLETRDDVSQLLGFSWRVLGDNGHLVLTFRDLSTPLSGPERFLSVRSDEDRILTCFLEYGEDVVQVHDLLHLRTDQGWTLRASSYPKLILPAGWLVSELETLGFQIERTGRMGGLHLIHAVKPSQA